MEENVSVAVDGACRAFLEDGVISDVVVTDLDGDVNALVGAASLGSVMIVHAHGDNIQKIKEIVPKLEGRVYGTTQRTPTQKVLNFGGFTDGDRAVVLAERFKPKTIYLAGMDFGGEVGEYSGTYGENKLKKIAVGKRILEGFAAQSGVPILNLSAAGEELKNISSVTLESIVF